MKKYFRLFGFLIIFSSIAQAAEGAQEDALAAEVVQKKASHEETGMIHTNIRKIGNDCYALDLDYDKQPVCCVYEKISPENQSFWSRFLTIQQGLANLKINQILSANEPDLEKLEVAGGSSGGVTGFGNILSEFHRKACETWCTYICTNRIDKQTKVFSVDKETEIGNVYIRSESGCAGIDNIEMIVGVATSDEVPFYVHRGIFRSIYRQHYNINPQIKNIALLLHGFAAFMQNHLNPILQKPYMITQPLKHMRRILIGHFSNNIYVGDSKNLKRQEEAIQKYNSLTAQEIVQQYKNHPGVIQIDENNNFILSRNNKVIWERPNKNHWFFSIAETSTEEDPYVVIDRTTMIELFRASINRK